MLVRSLPRLRNVFKPSSMFLASYHSRVLDHYDNPRNVGSLPSNDPNVGTGLVGAPACGDVMKLQIRVNEEGIITEAKFKTFGCGSAIASSSLATSWAQGKHIEDVIKIKNTEIAKHLSLPPVKLHCSMLAEDAIKAAYQDVKNKQAKLKLNNPGNINSINNTIKAGG
jgi:Fe-S cluster assembly scaffold IscU